MSREKRRKVLGATLVLLGLFAGSGTAMAWEPPFVGWHVPSAEMSRFWRQAWSGVLEIWGVATSAIASDAGQTQIPSSVPNTPGDHNHAEHSIMIDPNG